MGGAPVANSDSGEAKGNRKKSGANSLEEQDLEDWYLTKSQVLVKSQQMPVDALSVADALSLLHHCLSENGEVIPGRHFREELTNEGLTIPDAWHVLLTGRIYDPPEQDIKSGDWKYRVEGDSPDGIWLVITFCFRTFDRAFLITVFSVESRRKP